MEEKSWDQTQKPRCISDEYKYDRAGSEGSDGAIEAGCESTGLKLQSMELLAAQALSTT